jgi:hypothetical protein
MNIEELYPSKYLRASDLNGRPKRVTIGELHHESISGTVKNVLTFTSGAKSLILNKTNARAIAKILGDAESENWTGHDVVLFPTQVEFGNKFVDAIRVRAAPPRAQQQQKPQSPPPDEDPPYDDDPNFVSDYAP